jgi:hypothetical protein
VAPSYAVAFDGGGAGSVASSLASLSCDSASGGCASGGVHASDLPITLTAEADTGSTFTGWSGACSGTSATCTVTLDQALSVNATFDVIPAGPVLTVTRTGGPVTVTSSPAGIDCQADAGGAQTCSASFTQGEVVTLTAVGEWGLPSFTGCTPVVGSNYTCTVTMDADATVAIGAPVAPSYAVDFDGGGAGSVASSLASLSCDSASGGCASGGVHSSDYPITLTATEAPGSIFGSWSGCPSASGATCTIGSASGGDPLLTVTAVFHKAVTGLAAADVGREGAQLTWDAMPSDGYLTGVQVSHRVTGDTTWTSTSAPATNSYTLTGLTPGTQYDARVTVSFGDGTSSEATLTFTTPAAVSGSALDWNENQTTPTAAGGKLAVSWDATTLYFGLTNSAGQPVLVNPGDTVWLALDTDPATDASGSSSIASTIFPFRADKIVQVSLVDAAGTIFAQVQDGSGGFSTPASFASAVGAYDAFQIAKAEVGDPTRVRLAATVYDATGLISTDLAPVNPNATDVWGVHTSLTSSLDSNGGLWNPATGLASMSTLTSSEAPNLVAITVHQPDGVTGTLKVRGDVLPLDWFVENTHYALADDGNHGDGAAADGTWGGRFNFDGATRELFFKFMDDATYAGTCDTAPCPEPTFNNDGTERVWTLSGTAETLPTLEWNTVYDASHAFSLVFNLSSGGTPTEVSGSISELSTWNCGGSVTFADTGTQDGNGTKVWTAMLFASNYDFVTTPLEFKAIYGCGNFEGPGGNHILNDDVINTRTLSWTAGDGAAF